MARLIRLGLSAALLVACSDATLRLLGPVGETGTPGAADTSVKDAAVVLASVQNALAGCLVAIAQWLAGAGVAAFVLRRRSATVADVYLAGYIAGLMVTVLLCVIALRLPFGHAVAGLIWCLCASPLILGRYRPVGSDRVLRHIALVVPLAIVFGAMVGLFKHGPTATLAAMPPGDTPHYAGSIWVLATELFLPPNFGFEGERHSYFNMLLPLVGAALIKLYDFDTFLFITSGGSAAFIVFACVSTALFVADLRRETGQPLTAIGLAILLIAALTSSLYPTWIVDSPPMVYMFAVTVGVCHMVRKGRSDHLWAILAVACAGVGTLLSKIVTGGVLMPYAMANALPQLRRLDANVRRVLLITSTAAGLYAALMLRTWLPEVLKSFEVIPASLLWLKSGFADTGKVIARDLSSVLLAVGAVLALPWWSGLAVAGSLMLGTIYYFSFSPMVQCASLALGLALVEQRKLNSWVEALCFLGFLLAIPKGVFGDASGWTASWVWLICFGTGLVVLLFDGEAPAPASRALASSLVAVLIAALTVSLGLAAVARGKLRVISGYGDGKTTLTPADRDIWRAVRTMTPADSLIFSGLVTLTPLYTGGWNTYSYHGARQVYFSQYVQTHVHKDKDLLQARFDENLAVIEGRKKPQDVRTARRYSSYFLVAGNATQVGSHWQRIHYNPKYSLYRWAGQAN